MTPPPPAGTAAPGPCATSGRFFAPTCPETRVARERWGIRKRRRRPSASTPCTADAQTASAVPMRGAPAPRACPEGCTAGEGPERGEGAGVPLGVPRTWRPLTPAWDCRTPDLIHSVRWVWMTVKKAAAQMAPGRTRPAHVRKTKHPSISVSCTVPACGSTTLGRTPRPFPREWVEVGRGRTLVACWPRAGGVLPSPEG